MIALFIVASAMIPGTNTLADEVEYTQTVCPLERNGTALFLSQTLLSGTGPEAGPKQNFRMTVIPKKKP